MNLNSPFLTFPVNFMAVTPLIALIIYTTYRYIRFRKKWHDDFKDWH